MSDRRKMISADRRARLALNGDDHTVERLSRMWPQPRPRSCCAGAKTQRILVAPYGAQLPALPQRSINPAAGVGDIRSSVAGCTTRRKGDGMNTPLARLIAAKEQVIGEMRHGTPASWRERIHDFLADLRALEDLPPGAVALVFAEIIDDVGRFAGGAFLHSNRTITDRLDNQLSLDASTDALCGRFEQCLDDWFANLEPGVLVPSVQAQRVAQYIDQHFFERITLKRLNAVSGWDERCLRIATMSTCPVVAFRAFGDLVHAR